MPTGLGVNLGMGAPNLTAGEGGGATSMACGFSSGSRMTPGKSPPGPILSSGGVGRSGYTGVVDWPPEPEELAAAAESAPPRPRAAIPPTVKAAASRKVNTTLSAECGKGGGFSGRYAPVAMESEVRIAVLRANRAAARYQYCQSIATRPAGAVNDPIRTGAEFHERKAVSGPPAWNRNIGSMRAGSVRPMGDLIAPHWETRCRVALATRKRLTANAAAPGAVRRTMAGANHMAAAEERNEKQITPGRSASETTT